MLNPPEPQTIGYIQYRTQPPKHTLSSGTVALSDMDPLCPTLSHHPSSFPAVVLYGCPCRHTLGVKCLALWKIYSVCNEYTAVQNSTITLKVQFTIVIQYPNLVRLSKLLLLILRPSIHCVCSKKDPGVTVLFLEMKNKSGDLDWDTVGLNNSSQSTHSVRSSLGQGEGLCDW